MTDPVTIGDATLYRGDCLEILPTLAAGSVDAVVTDPPAGIGFMGKKWDHDKGGRDQWITWMSGVAVECLRVLKPGGHALVWALPRTSHWTATAWENAGFEVRDRVSYLFGSGFPKSLDVSKAIDSRACREHLAAALGREPTKAEFKAAWKEWRKVVGRDMSAVRVNSTQNHQSGQVANLGLKAEGSGLITRPATPAAAQWQGWGTALKPAVEDWWLLRKPLEGTVAANVLVHGTGGLNIDACRIGTDDTRVCCREVGAKMGPNGIYGESAGVRDTGSAQGRWPAHLVHDGSEEVVGLFPQTQGGTWNRTDGARHFNNDGKPTGYQTSGSDRSKGSAARFFYAAKASKADRDEGLDGLPSRSGAEITGREPGSPGLEMANGKQNPYAGKAAPVNRNHHPTVKPTALMRWLVRLVTPPGGVVLDPFMGSGSTGKACAKEGFRFLGIEADADYFEIARRRIDHAMTGGPLLAGTGAQAKGDR